MHVQTCTNILIVDIDTNIYIYTMHMHMPIHIIPVGGWGVSPTGKQQTNPVLVRACVCARALDVESELPQQFQQSVSLFPFPPLGHC